MFSRSLIMLGLGVALAFGAPATSFAQQATSAQQTASTAKPEPVIKKKKPAKKPASANKTVAKAPAKAGKGTAKKPEAEAAEEKPKGLFATLFGAPKDAKKDSAKKVAVAKKPKPEQAKEDNGDKPAAKRPWLFASYDQPEPQPRGKLQPLNPITPVEPVAVSASAAAVIASGNNGELRSGNVTGGGFMASVFGAEDQMLPETRALDGAMRAKTTKKKGFQVAEKWQPQVVAFSGYPRGTIVIDTANHFLYLVEGLGTARRYGIAVGKDGLQYKGNVKVGDKQEWPRWIPTLEMQQRNPKDYGKWKDGMPGGGSNPLGARAIYLYDGKKDTHLRIHGTIAPQSIGTNSSNGCFRMVNEHVIDLYRRVPVGTTVVVM